MFIVMEFVEGTTLRERMAGVSTKQAIDIGIQVADGLSAAHEKGIVHRDIKPENIMVRKDGIAQIMDFGLAKLRGNNSRISRLTKEGSTIGTVGYMSPEQVQGQDVDHRSDIFSLGVLLYELFTGQLPFKGVHETALLYEIVNVDPAPMAAVKPELDPALDGIVLECLVKEPQERYQSVAEVAKELRRVKRESTRQRVTRTMTVKYVDVPAPSPRAAARSRQLLWPAVAALLAVAVAVLAWSPWRSAPDMPVMCFGINLPLTSPLVTGAATIAIAPDGTSIVYLAEASGVPQLFLRPIDRFTADLIPSTEGAVDPFFSPDGQWIGFFAFGKLRKVSIHGGSPVDICPTEGFPRGGWWSSDDIIWYGNVNNVIYRVPAGGGTPSEATRMDSINREISHRFPQMLPDHKNVIFTVKKNDIASFDDAIIASENVETHERKILVRGGSFARYVPTGHLLYARGKSIYAVPLDVSSMEIKGTPRPVIEGGMLNALSGNANFDVSNNGTLAYVPFGPVNDVDSRIAWVNRDGTIEPLADTVRPYGPLSLSPDGQRIVVTVRAANDDIWVYHLGRKTLTRLTFGGGNSDLPVWTPDGSRILYFSERGKEFKIFLKPWDGSRAEEELGNSLNPDGSSPATISPDGHLVAYSKGGDIWTVSLDGDRTPKPFIQSAAQEFLPRFSPDGKWLAYTSSESGRPEVYVVPFPDRNGKWQVSTNGGLGPLWTKNGSELLYVEGRTIMKVDVAFQPSLDFSSPHKLFELPPSWTGTISVTPDGKRCIVELTKARDVSATQVNVVVGWFGQLIQKFRQGTD
jgi:serine/threonine-protein kinase